jgi:hypothetical protein
MDKQMHVVLYKVNPNNPRAADMMVAGAKESLGQDALPRNFFFVGRIINTGRAVGDASWDVLLALSFASEADYRLYMEDALHLIFVRFVLRGWMLEGGDQANAEREFIDYVLKGGEKRKWVRNPEIPDEEVVWGGEVVIDAVS